MRYPLRRSCHMFVRSGGRRTPPPAFFKKKNLYLWTHLHNLIKQNNNFSILKKIENPLLNPLNDSANSNRTLISLKKTEYDYDYDYEMLLLRHKEIQYNMS